MSQDVKIFDLEVWGSKNIQIKTFNILRSCFRDVKKFDLEVWESMNIQIEAFSIQGHGPRMLKASNRRFLDPQTSDSKLLTSWGHVPGC